MSIWGAAVIGGASLIGAGMTSKSAKDATKVASDASEASLAFERQKYDDFKLVYGDVQDNLSAYYNNLTPEYYEAQGLELFQQEHQDALEQARSSLAQRGIADSGIAAQLEISSAQEQAVQRSTIRQQAPGVVAAEKERFLQIGLGQNPGDSYSRVLSQQATSSAADARASEAAAGEATRAAVTTVGTGLSDYLNRPAAPPPPPANAGAVSANYTRDYSTYS